MVALCLLLNLVRHVLGVDPSCNSLGMRREPKRGVMSLTQSCTHLFIFLLMLYQARTPVALQKVKKLASPLKIVNKSLNMLPSVYSIESSNSY